MQTVKGPRGPIRRRLTVALAVAVPTLVVAVGAGASGAHAPESHASGAVAPGAAVPRSSLQAAVVGNSYPISVGIPNGYSGHLTYGGMLDYYLPNGGGQRLSEADLGLIGQDFGADNRFGASASSVDLNQDGNLDLLVGAPGSATSGPGQVDVVLGTKIGLTGTGVTTLSRGVAGDEFGTTIALTSSTLWVGAPGTEVDGKADAGAIYRYSLDEQGHFTFKDEITEDSPLVPGSAETGDRFGDVITGGSPGIVVGVPLKDIGTAKDAGEILALPVDDSGNLLQGFRYDQNSTGVAGTAEAGDHFGAAMSGGALAVGVPGEDVGSLKDAGQVQIFDVPGEVRDGHLTPAFGLTQNSPGIPGVAEAGDQFGSAVADGSFDCLGLTVAIGSPGEDVGKVADAGSVTVTGLPFLDSMKECRSEVLTQGTGLPGAAEHADGVGTALGVSSQYLASEEDGYDMLLIGDPGEDTGTSYSGHNAGRVITFNYYRTQIFGPQGGDWRNMRYGSVFG